MHSNIWIIVQCLVLTTSFGLITATFERPAVGRSVAFVNWYDQLNDQLALINRYSAHYEWELSTNPDDPFQSGATRFGAFKSKWVYKKCQDVIDLLSLRHEKAFRQNSALIEIIWKALCAGPKFTPYQSKELINLLSAMQNIYTNTRICLPRHFDICLNLDRIWEFTYVQRPGDRIHLLDLTEVVPKCILHPSELQYFSGNQTRNIPNQLSIEMGIRSGSMICFESEPDLEQIMKGDFTIFQRNDCSPQSNDIFRWAWESWRLAVGPKIQALYPKLVHIMNIGARNNGYHDIGELWRSDVDLPNFERQITDLVNQIEPFYKLLHGVLRNSLWKRVKEFEHFDKNKTIPAHLLGKIA